MIGKMILKLAYLISLIGRNFIAKNAKLT